MVRLEVATDLDEPPRAAAYFPVAQWFQPAMTLHVRVADRPPALIEPVRDALRRVHADLPAAQARTLTEHASAATFVPRVGTTVLGTFSVAALFLAGLGIYGTVSAAAAVRTREIGIRIALGASRRAIAQLVLRRALVVAGLGVGAGAAAAFVAARALASTVPGLNAIDVLAFAEAAAILLLVLATAALVPVRRAWRTDTAMILRSE